MQALIASDYGRLQRPIAAIMWMSFSWENAMRSACAAAPTLPTKYTPCQNKNLLQMGAICSKATSGAPGGPP